MVNSSSSPLRGRGRAVAWAPSTTPYGRRPGPNGRTASGELRLDRVQDRLAVRVAALVVAHLAQLRRRQAAEAAHHLVGREVVVGRDREVRAHSRRAPGAIRLRQRRRPRARRAAARAGHLLARSSNRAARRLADPGGAALDLVAPATEQLLEVLEHVVGLLAPPLEQARGEPLSVGGGHAAAIDRLLECLLDALAREHHHLHRADQVLTQGLAELGNGLGLDARLRGGPRRAACRGLRGLARLLLACASLAALLRGGLALGRGRRRAAATTRRRR